jgi:HSP20 family molecular chaperone IbpA
MNDTTMTRSEGAEAGAATTPTSALRNRSDNRYLLPRVDVMEDSRGITLLTDLPGVPRDKLDIRVEGNSLTLEGEIALQAPQGLNATFAEVRAPRYRRGFTLSSELDTQAIDAQLKDGVLRLRIPKLAEAQPRRIEVRID